MSSYLLALVVSDFEFVEGHTKDNIRVILTYIIPVWDIFLFYNFSFESGRGAMPLTLLRIN